MVRRGEYLERAVVIPGEPTLSGLHHRGSAALGVLILSPGPDEGGMEVPSVAELAWALTRTGHPTLRFDYPGVGASAGHFDLSSALQAAERSREHLQACLPDRASAQVGFAGVGLGAALIPRLSTQAPDADRFMVQPDRKTLLAGPPASELSGEVVLVAAAGDAEADRNAWRGWLDEARSGRMMVVPEADRGWRRHLVVVGQAAGELFSPPGMLKLT